VVATVAVVAVVVAGPSWGVEVSMPVVLVLTGRVGSALSTEGSMGGSCSTMAVSVSTAGCATMMLSCSVDRICE
jgi:hypothetical protein